MSSLETTVPALKELAPRVMGQLAELMAARAAVATEAAALLAQLQARAAEGAVWLEKAREAAAALDGQMDGEREHLASALAVVQSALQAQVQAIGAAEQEARSGFEALEASASALRIELGLVDSETAAAWTDAERALGLFRGDLAAQGAEMEILLDELAPAIDELAGAPEHEQGELGATWDRVREVLDVTLEYRKDEIDACAGRLREAAELHDVALEAAALDQVEQPGGLLGEQLARRLVDEVEAPLAAALDGALAALDAAAAQDTALAGLLAAGRAELAAGGEAVRALLPAIQAQIEIARTAAEQTSVDWRP